MILREIINNKITEKPVNVLFDETYDLVVVGLGTAGAISLIVAAEEGLKVLGVEQFYEMGGTGTIGAITYYYYGNEGGSYVRFDEQAENVDEELFVKGNNKDSKALTYEKAALEHGANIKYNTIVVGVFVEGRTIVGVRLWSNRKFVNVKAKAFIDASGEANLCHIAGCETIFGRDFDNQTQPFTFVNYAVGDDGRVYGINKDFGALRSYDLDSVSKMIFEGNAGGAFLKEDYSVEGLKYISASALLGIREGRRIIGDDMLCLSDVLKFEKNSSEVMLNAYSNVDNHSKELAFEDEILCEWMVVAGLWGMLISVPITKNVLIPRELDNVIVSGRCMSVDHNLASCVRMKRDMAKSGEAAAYVCCESVRDGISLRDVNYNKLREKLEKSKCLNKNNKSPEVISDLDELRNQLGSPKPGWAIWCLRILAEKEGKAINEFLVEMLSSADDEMAKNAALALGLIGDKRCIPFLRKMIGDNYIAKSSRKYVYPRGIAAIYLLGKMADEESIEKMFEIVTNCGRIDLEGFEFDDLFSDRCDVYSQYILFAVRAICDIVLKAKLSESILVRLKEVIGAEDVCICLSLKENEKSQIDVKHKVIEYVESAIRRRSDNV